MSKPDVDLDLINTVELSAEEKEFINDNLWELL